MQPIRTEKVCRFWAFETMADYRQWDEDPVVKIVQIGSAVATTGQQQRCGIVSSKAESLARMPAQSKSPDEFCVPVCALSFHSDSSIFHWDSRIKSRVLLPESTVAISLLS